MLGSLVAVNHPVLCASASSSPPVPPSDIPFPTPPPQSPPILHLLFGHGNWWLETLFHPWVLIFNHNYPGMTATRIKLEGGILLRKNGAQLFLIIMEHSSKCQDTLLLSSSLLVFAKTSTKEKEKMTRMCILTLFVQHLLCRFFPLSSVSCHSLSDAASLPCITIYKAILLLHIALTSCLVDAV
ncbi:hypothetical protein DL96DRAFT_557328 [Flagelloscypha sp. PMI_526]|nr:hypothetical protein DL96DRAFT_557328 [Flagelloscypha sp. PMI_526]